MMAHKKIVQTNNIANCNVSTDMYPLEKCRKPFALSKKEERHEISLKIAYSQIVKYMSRKVSNFELEVV